MKIRTKSHLAIALPLIAATAVLIFLVRYIELKNALEVDEQMARRTVQRVRKMLQQELEVSGQLLAQYAASAPLAHALEIKDRAYFKERFNQNYLKTQGWDLMVLWSLEGKPVYGVMRGEESATQEISPSVMASLGGLPGVATGLGRGEAKGFFGVVDGDLQFLRYAAVTGRSDQKAIAGALMVGHRMRAADFQRLSQLADVRLEAEVIPAAARSQKPPTTIVVKRLPDGSHACEFELTDWTGLPIAVLKLQVEGLVLASRRSFVQMEFAALIIGAILLFLLLDRLIWTIVSKRLTRLSESMVTIQRNGDFNRRLPVDGSDEVSILAQETNRMLERVQSSQGILERVNAEMQQRVAERTMALHEANKALEADISVRIKAEKEQELLRAQLLRAQKMEAVGTLAGGIAHDFNNILTGILGYAQLLHGDLANDHPNQQNVKQVIAAAERATGLVKQILTFSRQSPGEKSVVSMHRVTSEAMVLLKAGLPSNIQARLTGITERESIQADITQMHQVLMNLGTNAGHAMKAHGGLLEIDISRIAAPVRRPDGQATPGAGDMIRLSVKDNGTGIPKEVLPRIFDPFFSTKPVNEGTGLGLAVVHGIVTDHGGWIEVHSETGRGTRFDLFFPAVEAKADISRSRPPMMVRGDSKVLLVDDEGLVLGVIEKNLKRLGYKVTSECDPRNALKRYEADPMSWDLVITDYMMPGMSGLDFHRAMRKLNPAQRVILMTGYSPDVSGRSAEEFGLSRIVEKPVSMVLFSEIVRDVIAAPAA